MSVAVFNTHAFKRLKAAGMPEAQAEALADELTPLIDGRLATTDDLANLATKADLADLKSATKADFADLPVHRRGLVCRQPAQVAFRALGDLRTRSRGSVGVVGLVGDDAEIESLSPQGGDDDFADRAWPGGIAAAGPDDFQPGVAAS